MQRCFTYVWNSVHKITKYSSCLTILIFVIFRKKLAQKSSVFIKLLTADVTVLLLTLLKVYLHTMCFTHDWSVARKITKYSSWSEILIFVIFRKKLAQKSSVFVKQLLTNFDNNPVTTKYSSTYNVFYTCLQ
jgi:hypothetical protein